MDTVQIALLVLLALVVGMVVPLLVQVYSLVSSARQLIERNAKDAEAAMKGVHAAVERIDRITAQLERDGRIETIVSGLASAAQVANQMKGTLQTATSVVAAATPALAAAVAAFRGSMERGDGPAQVHGSSHAEKGKEGST